MKFRLILLALVSAIALHGADALPKVQKMGAEFARAAKAKREAGGGVTPVPVPVPKP